MNLQLMNRTTTICFFSALFIVAAHPAQAARENRPKAWTDPDVARQEDPDFAIQGEYGSASAGAGLGVQVVALGNGQFDAYLLQDGLPGLGWAPGKSRTLLKGVREGDKATFTGADKKISAKILGGNLLLTGEDGRNSTLPRIERTSPSLGAKPPKEALVLFDGGSAEQWENGKSEKGCLLATGCTSKQRFGDYTLHLEFRTPYMPLARGQGRGNSGVYHSGRWETQVLDSFGLEGEDNECGGIYSVSKPRLNMCLPPLSWQTYDVDFTAATFDANGKRTAWPRITVRLNGVIVHEDLELNKDFTTSAPINQPLVSPEGPVYLQNHGNPVVYRNIWIVPHTPGAEPKPQIADLKPDILRFDPFTWPSEIPEACPFERSKAFNAIRFLGVKSGFPYGDTWYPSWAENDILYSPWTDGKTKRLDGYTDWSQSWVDPVHITTGQGVIIGDDPLNLIAYSIGLDKSSPAAPYPGRYPCGSLIHNGVWYYGTYCLGPGDGVHYGKTRLNWPWIGPFVGFRHSTDYGHNWTPPPHTPSEPLFGETGMWGHPVKIGAPKFVDFGKNMQHSPDGKAYLVAHGADQETTSKNWRMWNDSWITGDQIYLLRVTPGIKTINDPAAYEFYGGRDKDGKPVWTGDFGKIKPLLEWDNNMGCVTVTYNPVLKNYIMCVTDGGNTVSRMNTYLLEADRLDGDWKIITYMKEFGTQAYFVNIPSKFIGSDGVTMWLLYSGNFSLDQNQKPHPVNPPGGHYGMTFQKIELLRNESSGTVRGSE